MIQPEVLFSLRIFTKEIISDMSEAPKPIKRSPQLTPLSHDHHDGLLFAWKIKQGLKKGTDLNAIADYVNWFWENHLVEHFRKEDKVIAPLMPAEDVLIKRMSDEHEEIEALVQINKNIPDAANLEVISEKVNDHIRFEERILFPHIEKTLSEYQLDYILKKLSVEAPTCGEWKDEFWKN
jgi:hemerythrin-like domain-containing protein